MPNQMLRPWVALVAAAVTGCSAYGGASDADMRSIAQSVLGLNDCTGPVVRSSGFENAYLDVGAPKSTCVRWYDASARLDIESGSVTIGESRIPVVYFIPDPRKANAGAPETIVVRVVGGPGGRIDPAPPLNTFMSEILGPNDVAIALGYTGTHYGSLYPHEDLTAASHEIAVFTQSLRRRLPRTRIVLIGESLGTHIVASSLLPAFGGVADRLVLLAPMGMSANETMAHDLRLLAQGRAQVREVYVRTIERPSTNWGTGKLIAISGKDYLLRFIPPSEASVDLVARLQRISARPTLIVFGSEDDDIGPGNADRLVRLSQTKVTRFEGVGHQIYDHKRYPQAIGKRVARFLHSGT
jgi:hypothetical protein